MSEASTTRDLVELTRRRTAAADAGDFELLLSFYRSDAIWYRSGTPHAEPGRSLKVVRLIERIEVYGDVDEARAAAERLAEERG